MTKRFNVMHFESKGFKKLMVFAMEKVTPALAQDLLTLNNDNRPLKNATLKQYTDDMKEDNWEFTGDTINISKEGKLINGQHRLLAIINSGKDQVFNIQTGLEPKAFEYMDIGKQRSAGDAMAMKWFENYNTVASTVKFVKSYRDGHLKKYAQGESKKFVKMSIADVSAFVELMDIELLKEVVSAGHKLANKFRILSAPTYASFLYIFSKIKKDDAFDFFEALASGENISKDSFSMIYLLRNKLINMSAGSQALRLTDKFALIIKAWNFYRKNTEIKILSWNSDNEDFPKPI